MKIVVCAKQVLDPDGVNAYAIWGRLNVDADTRWLKRNGIPLLMNAFDEQALEAALRLRDQGIEGHVTVVTMGDDEALPMFRHALAMGADDGVLLRDPAFRDGDGLGTAYVLALAIAKLGGADLILCGRQASDDDQGIVGPALAQLLGMPAVTLAKEVSTIGEKVLHVTRVLPEGDEVVEVELPALVTVSNELGQPRYPTARGMMDARRKEVQVWSAQDLEMDVARVGSTGAHVRRVDLSVPQVQGQCQLVSGDTPAQTAALLAQRLHQDGLI